MYHKIFQTQAFEKDRVAWQERESELTDHVKALQETISVLAQQNEQKKNGQSNPNNGTVANDFLFFF